VTPAIGHIPLARLSPAAIQHLYVAFVERGLAPATVRQMAAILHAALSSAVRSGIALRNPADNTTLPSMPEYTTGHLDA